MFGKLILCKSWYFRRSDNRQSSDYLLNFRRQQPEALMRVFPLFFFIFSSFMLSVTRLSFPYPGSLRGARAAGRALFHVLFSRSSFRFSTEAVRLNLRVPPLLSPSFLACSLVLLFWSILNRVPSRPWKSVDSEKLLRPPYPSLRILGNPVWLST